MSWTDPGEDVRQQERIAIGKSVAHDSPNLRESPLGAVVAHKTQTINACSFEVQNKKKRRSEGTHGPGQRAPGPGRRSAAKVSRRTDQSVRKKYPNKRRFTSNADGSVASRNMQYADASPRIRVRQSETDRTGLSSSTSLAYGHTRLIDRGTRA